MTKHKKEDKKFEKHAHDKKRKVHEKDLEKVSGGAPAAPAGDPLMPLGPLHIRK
jgi:hypothetical protein